MTADVESGPGASLDERDPNLPGAHPRKRRGFVGALAGSALLHALGLGALLAFASLTPEARSGPRGPGAASVGRSGHAMSILPVNLLAAGGQPAAGAEGEAKPDLAQSVPLLETGPGAFTAPPERLEPLEQSEERGAPAVDLASAALEPAPGGAPSGASEPEAAGHAGTFGDASTAIGRGGLEGQGASAADGTAGGGATGTAVESDLVPPIPLHIAVPAIPGGIDRERARGARVTLGVYVLDSGEISEVKLLQASGIAPLDGSALEAGRRLRYAPATRNGEPVSMWARAEITF